MKHHSTRSYLVGALLAVASSSAAWALEINTATPGELIKLGFSRIVAERIVAYHKSHGDFQSSTDVLKVKGVTPTALNRAATKLTINGNSLTAQLDDQIGKPAPGVVEDAPQGGNMSPVRNTPNEPETSQQQP